jgi:predicted Rossmann fold nucleotide-binding protein DprA/Smf involved in DNA uptake
MASDLLTRIRGEIEERLRELRPALEEYERLLDAAEDVEEVGATRRRRRAASRAAAPRNGAGPARVRAPRGAAQEAIVAALEHGSHTVSELAVVTAMSGPSLRQSLRRLVLAGTVTQAKREGKLAYALASRRR